MTISGEIRTVVLQRQLLLKGPHEHTSLTHFHTRVLEIEIQFEGRADEDEGTILPRGAQPLYSRPVISLPRAGGMTMLP